MECSNFQISDGLPTLPSSTLTSIKANAALFAERLTTSRRRSWKGQSMMKEWIFGLWGFCSMSWLRDTRPSRLRTKT